MQKGLGKGGNATRNRHKEAGQEEKCTYALVLTAATGLGRPIAEKRIRPAPVTMWYNDEVSSPRRRYSRIVVHSFHFKTSGPNLKRRPEMTIPHYS